MSVGNCIDDALPEQFDSTGPLLHPSLQRNGNFRTMRDEDYRAAIMETAVKDGRARSSSSAAQLSGVGPSTVADWQQRQASGVLTSSRRQFSNFEGILGVYADAARIGHPAEDTMIMVAEDASRQVFMHLSNRFRC